MDKVFADRQKISAAPAKAAGPTRGRAAPAPAFGRDLSRVPLSRTMLAEDEAELGSVSRTDAGVRGGSGAPVAPMTASTRTLVSAPDGTADTRRTVGVNEEVELSSSGPAAWTASVGTVTIAGGKTTWTAPGAAGLATLTAAPASGSAVTVAMTVVPPTSRALTLDTNRTYDPDRSGSGFFAKVVIQPTTVSFKRTEFREETVNAVATGYYKTVMGWDGMAHPVTSWISPDAANSGLLDKIGTNSPGGPKPFSSGSFLWAIPQSFRTPGVGAGTVYSTARHLQTMFSFPMGLAAGAETTSKEGASRMRIPAA